MPLDSPAMCVLVNATALVFLRDPQLHHQPQHHHDERRAKGGEGHTSRSTSNLLPQEFLIGSMTIHVLLGGTSVALRLC